jgi:hypothetical protein
VGPYKVRLAQAREDSALAQTTLDKARRTQLQRRVAALEKLQQRGRDSAGDSDEPEQAEAPQDPQALLAQARQLTETLEQAELAQRAQELARLLGVKPEEALRQLQADQKPPPAASGDLAQQMTQLEQRARQAVSRSEAIAGRAGQGSAVTASSESAGGGGGRGSPVPLSGGSGFQDPRNYNAVAAVDPATARGRIGSGRVIGPGGAEAARVVLSRWYIAGPFAARGSADLNRAYPPELAVDLDAVYAGKDGRSLRWQYVDEPGYPLVPQPRFENAVYYAYTEIRVDRAQDVWLDIGADDDSKLWLNDQLVWTSGDGDKPWYRQPFYSLEASIRNAALVEGSRRVHLRAGRNRLLFKLYNGIDLMFFSVVLRP